MLFNKNLNYLTSHSGKKIGSIADDLSIGYESFRKYLNISQPKFEVVIKIASYFHISIDDLLTRDIEKEGFLEANKNNVVSKDAPSVYLPKGKTPNLNHIISDMVQEELGPMQLQLEELQDYIGKFVLLLKIDKKLEELTKDSVSENKPKKNVKQK